MTQLEALKKELVTFEKMRADALNTKANVYTLINSIDAWAKSEYVLYNDFIENINKSIKSKAAEIVRNNNSIIKLTNRAKELNGNHAATELAKIKDSFVAFKEKTKVLEEEIKALDQPLAKIREIENAINNPSDTKKSKFKQFSVNFFDFINKPLPSFSDGITKEFIFAVELRKFHMESEKDFENEFLVPAKHAVNFRFDKTQSPPWVNRLDEINNLKAQIESFNVISVEEVKIEKLDMSELEELLSQMETIQPIIADEAIKKVVKAPTKKKEKPAKVLNSLEALANS